MTHIHLIGIGGTGLSAIAKVLLEKGYSVSGSDLHRTSLTESLAASGAKIYIGHQQHHVNGADLVVRSSAIPDNNVEIQAAHSKGIKVLKRADFIGELMAEKMVIAVAGTHGKTSTAAMISWMLHRLNQDPSFILGGVVSELQTNAKSGEGRAFVVEADEYDRMFLGLRPDFAVITNVEHDHPDCYPTKEDFIQAFQSFVRRLSSDGILISCGDDSNGGSLRLTAREQGNKSVTYGLNNPSNDYLATNVRLSPGQNGYHFQINYKDRKLVSVGLNVPGFHNIYNATAAFVVADQMGLPLSEAGEAVSLYSGTERRFEVIGHPGGVTVISDYAHHPTEIRATLSAARSRYMDREIWAVWQPHTYSRTKLFFDDFIKSFEDADHIIVMEIYAARESAETYSASQIVDAMAHPDVAYSPTIDRTVEFLEQRLTSGDVLIVLSAGDADKICTQIIEIFG